MSQSRTVIQGLETIESGAIPQSMPSQAESNFYSRPSKANAGTVISGVTDNIPNAAPVQREVEKVSVKANMVQKPIVGFLYSISKTACGEFWPLTIGSNTIGLEPNCNIVLQEGTVSRIHATLQVRRDKRTGHISAWISDTMSTNGTMVNDDTLGSTPLDCKNGDIITVGDNYQLYLALIDATTLGLSVSEDFIPVSTNVAPNPIDIPSPVTPVTPDFIPTQPEFIPNDGTVGMDGSVSINRGGTVPM